ncbi:formylglycine-generating enzyme family protein [bacterium]|nr:formylglycine-generating enzyme family protein [bacterium]
MRKLLTILFLLLALSSFASDCLSDVSTSVTDDGKVLIVYTLTSSDPTNTFPVFSINFAGEIADRKPFSLKTLEGAGKTGVQLGEGTYTSIWNAAKDCKRDDPNTINISVEAEEVTDEATYLCLNLKTFKMRYQNDPPDVKKSSCKTKELWLRRIEPGTFIMGSPNNEDGHYKDEQQHTVTLTKAYYIGVFETTQKQFKSITGYNYSSFKRSTKPVDNVSYSMLRGDDKGANWPKDQDVDEYCSTRYYNYRGDLVITNVSTFFFSLRNKTGNTFLFDLPTEAQWEFACRAGTTSAFNDSDGELDKLARYWFSGGGNINKKGKSRYFGHAKVGSYLPNNWGLYDMHGNVWEWCLDWYERYIGYAATDSKGESSGTHRVLRGGSWLDLENSCRSATRSYTTPDFAYDNYGFRVALDVFSGPDNQIQKDFEFEIESGTENTMPIFQTKFYGKLKDGTEKLLEDMGRLEYDGASGIVAGTGKHKLTWIPDADYTNVMDEVELRVEYEDVTEQANYLVLDTTSDKMRVSSDAPDTADDKCCTDELWLRRIEPGTFIMGSPEDELGRRSDETQHEVTLTKAYYIGVFEMTQKQLQNIIGANPSCYKGDVRPVECVPYNMLRGTKDGSAWPNNNRVDESSFLGRLKKRTGNIFDLPTEAQWEFACRAGTTTALNSGKNLSPRSTYNEMAEVGRYKYNQNDGKGGYTNAHTTVGSYLPNAWGLYDMHGNVSEWCLDWYDSYDGDAADPKGVSSGTRRVLRGGSWRNHADYCRSAYRDDLNPDFGYDYFNPDYGNDISGFRLVLVQ